MFPEICVPNRIWLASKCLKKSGLRDRILALNYEPEELYRKKLGNNW